MKDSKNWLKSGFLQLRELSQGPRLDVKFQTCILNSRFPTLPLFCNCARVLMCESIKFNFSLVIWDFIKTHISRGEWRIYILSAVREDGTFSSQHFTYLRTSWMLEELGCVHLWSWSTFSVFLANQTRDLKLFLYVGHTNSKKTRQP